MRLTKAQRRFLAELRAGREYSNDNLVSAEIRMAERLQSAGLADRQMNLRRHDYLWAITDAGRAALNAVE